MSTLTARTRIGVVIPTYEMLDGSMLHAVEHASSVVDASSDEVGEFYAMAMIQAVPAAQVPENAVIVIPLTPPEEGQVLDMTYVAASSLMFLHVHEKPQARMTYAHCAAYSTGNLFGDGTLRGEIQRGSNLGLIAPRPRLSNLV